MNTAQKLTPLDESAKQSVLKDVGLFADIADSPDALSAIWDIMTERVFKPGSSITEEGNPGTEMFVLIAGKASVFKNTPGGDEYKVAIFEGKKHVAFGESGLIESEVRSATVRADTECRCLVMSRKAFEALSEKHPQWALPIYKRIAFGVMSRLRKTNEDMLLLYNALVAEIRGR
jgi:CRP/FNR family transcriptional regulator, cyclic AMP receptor protein